MEKQSLPSKESAKQDHVSWHFALAASIILSGCVRDTTTSSLGKNPLPQTNTPAEAQKKPLEQIEDCSKRIIETISQEISSNPKFQSLQYIKSYVAHELRKS